MKRPLYALAEYPATRKMLYNVSTELIWYDDGTQVTIKGHFFAHGIHESP